MVLVLVAFLLAKQLVAMVYYALVGAVGRCPGTVTAVGVVPEKDQSTLEMGHVLEKKLPAVEVADV